MEPVVILYSFNCFLTIPIRDCDGVDVACVFAGSSQCHRQPLVCLSEPFRRGGETPGTGFEKPTAGSLLFGIFVNTILIATSLLTFHLLDAVEFQSLRRKKAVWRALHLWCLCTHCSPDYINQDDSVIRYIHCFSKLFFFTMSMPVFTKQQEN